jgi:hypothetical protein
VSLGICGNPSINASSSRGTDVARDPGSLPLPSLQRFDDPHAVDALLVEPLESVFVELEVDVQDPEAPAVAEHQDFADLTRAGEKCWTRSTRTVSVLSSS